VGLPTLLENTAKRLEGLKKGGREALGIAEATLAAADSFREFTFVAGKEQITRVQDAISKEQVIANASRDRAQERVTIEREKFSKIESRLNESVRKQLSAEERLQRKRDELQVQGAGAGRPGGRQVVDLAVKAQQAAQRGNVDLAEQFIEKAKGISDELGNHVFFTDKIASAEKAVLRALESRVGQSKQAVSTDQQALADARTKLQLAEKQLATEKQRVKDLASSRTIVERRKTTLADEQQAERRASTASIAAEGIKEVRREINRARSVTTSFGDDVRAAFRGLFGGVGAVFKLGAIDEAVGTLAALEEQATKLEDIVLLENSGEAFEKAGQGAEQLKRVLTSVLNDPDLSPALLDRVTKLGSRLETLGKAQESSAKAGAAGIGFQENIEEQAVLLKNRAEDVLKSVQNEKIFTDNIKESTQALLDQVEALRARGQIPSTQGPQSAQPAVNQGAAASAPTNVNQSFAVTVRGGMIDREVVEQITDIVAREVRKATSTGVA
jgi:hypothetical protein